ncbi:MAG: hypothetical protein M0007_12255 [Actinomycetota bacterium]|nr:hypothetical protein [Actinomycetota bacterium]
MDEGTRKVGVRRVGNAPERSGGRRGRRRPARSGSGRGGGPGRWLTAALSSVLAFGVLSLVTTPASSAAGVSPGAATAGPKPHAFSPPTGYWLMAKDGGVFAFGNAGYHGSMGGHALNAPIVGGARTPSSNGYWEVAADGGIFTFGDAGYFGSMGGKHLNAPIVGMAATPDGQGYWEVASDGGIFAFGDAVFRGSMGGKHLNAPIVGMAATGTGNGYWEVASDGGVFTFGDATYHGSMGGQHLNRPIVGMAATQLGDGYWLVAADGGIFTFGDAVFKGSTGKLVLNSPIVGMSTTSDFGGYTLAAADGGVFTFGDAVFKGSAAVKPLNAPVVATAQIGPTVGGRVLLVGTFNGVPGQYATIQDAVNAAQPGDWILVAPGDYHENNDITNPPTASEASVGWFGGVEIDTPYIHLRGMNRNTTIVDGTKAGAPACSGAAADQNPGVSIAGYNGGSPIGRNGILVWKANGVSVDNLTVCNFNTGSAGGGNEVWWDGQPSEATTGPLGLIGYSGSYLTATSTYYDPTTNTDGAYGIFSSASSLGIWNNIYGSNFNDSGMYIGACRQLCDAWVHNAWMEYNPLGYSGTNSGGTLVISNSQFDNNQDGFDTNSQIAGDPPPVQNGACPDNGTSGFTHTSSCWVFMDNYVHDNNNPNVPKSGYAGLGPTGTGMTVSGGRNDTVMHNTFANNGAWGTLYLPFPDTDSQPPGVSCTGVGGTNLYSLGLGCLFDPWNDALLGNTYSNNGFFGNPTNGDYGNLTFATGIPQDCFAGNIQPNGSSPANLETTNAVCGTKTTTSNFSATPGTLGGEVLCDTGLLPSACAPTDKYPAAGTVTMKPLPSNLPTMPNPCAGVPANAWCPAGKPV